jgi:hypothetical protein
MTTTATLTGFDELVKALAKDVPASVNADALNRILTVVAQPFLKEMRRTVPVSKGGQRISLKHRKNHSANEYRRGGATKGDLRIKQITEKGNLYGAEKLVGVSKKKGKVGWRTHFIIQGIAGHGSAKAGPRDFIGNAYRSQMPVAQRVFQTEARTRYEKHLTKVGFK